MKTSTLLAALVLSGVLSASAQGAGVVQNGNPNQALAQADAALGGMRDPADDQAVQFQFSDAAAIASGSGTFSSARAFATGANFHGNATHSINATAKLANNDLVPWPISEPASELLMLVALGALGALAIAVRRRMPEPK